MSKLYTEDQMIQAYESGRGLTHEEVLEQFVPIQLPTDIEISKQATYHGVDEHSFFTEATQNQKTLSFLSGAKWMRDKIKGGQGE